MWHWCLQTIFSAGSQTASGRVTPLQPFILCVCLFVCAPKKFCGGGRSFSGAAPIGMNGLPLLIAFLIWVDPVILAISTMGRIAV